MTDPDGRCDARVFFASPKPCGDAVMDRVVVEWYARDANQQTIDAPAVLIVHELDGELRCSRLVARLILLNAASTRL